MKSLALYYIGINQTRISSEFAKNFKPFLAFDWYKSYLKFGLDKTISNFIDILKSGKYEYTFMQIQNTDCMTIQMIKEISKYTKIIHWTGDIRDYESWYEWFKNIGENIFLTLFSNEHQVNILRQKGLQNVDYLQVGFDDVVYNKQTIINKDVPKIVFCANDYGDKFPLSQYRREVVKALYKFFPNDFKVYGGGWQQYGINATPVNCEQESVLYNNCKIAISCSQFNFDRYYSDRLLRIMGCGCVPLSHNFKGIEKDFTPHNIAVFKDIPDLIYKCKDLLNKENKGLKLNAYKYAHNKATWNYRCKEIINLINKNENE